MKFFYRPLRYAVLILTCFCQQQLLLAEIISVNIYLLIIHTKLTIESNAQYIQTTQHNIKAKALNATHGSKLNC